MSSRTRRGVSAGSSVRSGWVWRILPIESETVSPSNGRFAVSIS